MKRHSRQHVYYQRRRWIRKRSRLLRAIEYRDGWRLLWPWQQDDYWDRLIGQLEDDSGNRWNVPRWFRVSRERPQRHRANQLVRMERWDEVPRWRRDAKYLWW